MSDADFQVQGRDELPLLLNRLGLEGEGIEIGVATGRFSGVILERSRLKRLYSIDVWRHIPEGYEHDAANRGNILQILKYLRTIVRLFKFGRRSAILRMSGDSAVERFGAGTLDFIYIDANHAYEAVKSDLETWWPKLKSGGVFAGHDYADSGETFGVNRAVDEFVATQNLRLYLTTEKDRLPISWYLRK